MKGVVIGAIRLYQILAPRSLRERCIFASSCSQFVLEGAARGGVTLAWLRLRQRMRVCGPGYYAVAFKDADGNDNVAVLLRDGSTVPASELNERAKNEIGISGMC